MQYQALVVEQKALTEDEFWSSSAMLKVAGVAGGPGRAQQGPPWVCAVAVVVDPVRFATGVQAACCCLSTLCHAMAATRQCLGCRNLQLGRGLPACLLCAACAAAPRQACEHPTGQQAWPGQQNRGPAQAGMVVTIAEHSTACPCA